jgi:hypothetical protein
VPTVLTIDGFQFSILLPPREHGPAHVHVTKGGKEVIVALTSVQVREIKGMRDADARQAVRLVLGNIELLRAHWRRIHG